MKSIDTGVTNIIIKDFYKPLIDNYINPIITESLLFVFKDNFDKFWQSLYDNAINENFHATAKRENFFFIGISHMLSHEEKRSVQQKTNSKWIDTKDENMCQELYRCSCKWDNLKRLNCLDLTTNIQIIKFNDFVKNQYTEFLNIVSTGSRFLPELDFIRNTRNTYSHLNANNANEINKLCNQAYFDDFITASKRFVSYLVSNKELYNKIKDLINDFENKCEKYREQAGLPPIEIEKFCEETGIQKRILDKICEVYSYRRERIGNKLCIVGISREKICNAYNGIISRQKKEYDLYHETTNAFSLDAINNIYDMPKLSVSKNTNNKSTSSDIKVTQENNKSSTEITVLPKLKYLSTYERGYLSQLQIVELFDRYNFFADLSALLKPNYREFITKTLIPYKKNMHYKNSPLFIHRSTRNELYQIANAVNNNSDYDMPFNSSIQNEAKQALNTIHELRKRNLVLITGIPSYEKSSVEMIKSLFIENSNRRFCILTDDKSVAKIFANTKIKTICAIKIAGDKPIVWSVIANNLKSDHYDENNTDKVKMETTKCENSSVFKINSEKQSNASLTYSNKHISYDFTNIDSEDYVFSKCGNKIKLLECIGQGGEACIYRTSDPLMAAKIYHQKNKGNRKKIEAMINDPVINNKIIWPLDILLDNDNNYVGFLMPLVPPRYKELGESVLKINNTRVAKEMLKGWKKKDLVNVCISITDIFSQLHSKKILMGDINASNILIDPKDSTKICFVDCDSYQIGDYLCPVGTALYTSPDYFRKCNMTPKYSELKRTISDENHSISVLLFQILMNGQIPYASKNSETGDIVEKICKNNFSFKTKNNDGRDVPDGIYKMVWNNLSRPIQNKFSSVFEDNLNVSAKDWNRNLKNYLNEIESKKMSNDLFPKKYVDTNGNFVDVECACCQAQINVYKDEYEKEIEKKDPVFLCNICRMTMKDIIKSELVTCANCGIKFHPTYRQLWMKKHKTDIGASYSFLCRKCKNDKFGR